MKKVKKHKISRRLQAPLFEGCQTQKFILREQRRAPKRRRGVVSEYGKQLAEKQKIRYLYSISERVLKKYVQRAITNQAAPAEEVLASILECRLDSIVYHLNLAPTRRMARQMVSHGHFTLNGKKITVPSCNIREGDVIGIREGSVGTKLFQTILTESKIKPDVEWVAWDGKTQTGGIVKKPSFGETIISFPAVLEYYSR